MNLQKPEKIAKLIAQSGLCSRREAEDWILRGRVAIDGNVVTTPALRVEDISRIQVDGKPLRKQEKTRLWLYYKPPGVVTTHADPQGRPTVFENLPDNLPRVISVGRLDLNSEGLLLLTNDGEFARFLEHPSSKLPRIYRVKVFGNLKELDIEALRKGVTIEGIRYREIEIEIIKQSGKQAWLKFKLMEGKNREIRKILNFYGLKVLKLIRQAYGPFNLEDLKPGMVKEVSLEEHSFLHPDLG